MISRIFGWHQSLPHHGSPASGWSKTAQVVKDVGVASFLALGTAALSSLYDAPLKRAFHMPPPRLKLCACVSFIIAGLGLISRWVQSEAPTTPRGASEESTPPVQTDRVSLGSHTYALGDVLSEEGANKIIYCSQESQEEEQYAIAVTKPGVHFSLCALSHDVYDTLSALSMMRGIIPLHGYSVRYDGEEREQYLVMKYCNQRDLTNFYQTEGFSQLPLRQRHKLALDLVHGLDSLHTANLRHGDIKPDNVVLHKDEEQQLSAYWIDFDATVELAHVTSPKFGVVTYAYCAPEYASWLASDGKASIDFQKVEAWALGITLCALYAQNGDEYCTKLYNNVQRIGDALKSLLEEEHCVTKDVFQAAVNETFPGKRITQVVTASWIRDAKVKRLLNGLLNPDPSRRTTIQGAKRELEGLLRGSIEAQAPLGTRNPALRSPHSGRTGSDPGPATRVPALIRKYDSYHEGALLEKTANESASTPVGN